MKRANKEDHMWDCSVCTYRNSPEAFKCLMCDVRKGTATRKPRLNAELVAAQVAQVIPPKPKKINRKSEGRGGVRGRPRLKNVDRSTAEHNAVTVNNVTVIITEFKPKLKTSTTGSHCSANISTGQCYGSAYSPGTSHDSLLLNGSNGLLNKVESIDKMTKSSIAGSDGPTSECSQLENAVKSELSNSKAEPKQSHSTLSSSLSNQS